jgi:hypothetical protein
MFELMAKPTPEIVIWEPTVTELEFMLTKGVTVNEKAAV